MNLFTDEINKCVKTIEAKLVQQESLSEEEIKLLLLNLLHAEDSHEAE